MTAKVPDDLIRYILDFWLNVNIKETISYVLVIKQFRNINIIRDILIDHVLAIKENPLIKHFFSADILNQDIHRFVLLINYSFKRHYNFEYYTIEFFYYLKLFLFFDFASSDLKSDSQIILKKYLNNKLNDDLLRLTDKNNWFPIVYEYVLNNLFDISVLTLCARYF